MLVLRFDHRLLIGFHEKYDWEENGTEVYPSGTFYFDTCVFFVLCLFGENFEVSDQRRGFLFLCGVCLVHPCMLSAQCMGGG